MSSSPPLTFRKRGLADNGYSHGIFDNGIHALYKASFQKLCVTLEGGRELDKRRLGCDPIRFYPFDRALYYLGPMALFPDKYQVMKISISKKRDARDIALARLTDGVEKLDAYSGLMRREVDGTVSYNRMHEDPWYHSITVTVEENKEILAKNLRVLGIHRKKLVLYKRDRQPSLTGTDTTLTIAFDEDLPTTNSFYFDDAYPFIYGFTDLGSLLIPRGEPSKGLAMIRSAWMLWPIEEPGETYSAYRVVSVYHGEITVERWPTSKQGLHYETRAYTAELPVSIGGIEKLAKPAKKDSENKVMKREVEEMKEQIASLTKTVASLSTELETQKGGKKKK